MCHLQGARLAYQIVCVAVGSLFDGTTGLAQSIVCCAVDMSHEESLWALYCRSEWNKSTRFLTILDPSPWLGLVKFMDPLC